MKRLLKRVLAFTLALIMSFSSISVNVFAGDETVIDEISVEESSFNEVLSQEVITLDESMIKQIEEAYRQQIEKNDDESEDVIEELDPESSMHFSMDDELASFDIYDEDECQTVEEYTPHTFVIEDDVRGETSINVRVIEYGTAKEFDDFSFSYKDGVINLSKDGYYPVSIPVDAVDYNVDTLMSGTAKFCLVPTSIKSGIAAVIIDGEDGLVGKGFINTKGKTTAYVITTDDVSDNAVIEIFPENKGAWNDSNGTYNWSGDKQKTFISKKVDASKITAIEIDPSNIEDINTNVNRKFMFGIKETKTVDGKTTETKKNPLKSGFQINGKNKNFDIKITDKIEVKIPNSVPVVGNSSFNIDLSLLPVAAEVTDDSVQVAINYDKSKKTGEDWKSGFDKCKKSFEDMKHPVESAKEKQLKAFNDAYDKSKLVKGLSGSFEVSVGGYIEFIWDDDGLTDVDGGIIIVVSGEFGGEWQIYAGWIPIVISASIGASANIQLGFNYDVRNSEWFFNGAAQVVLPEIKLSAGIGLAKIASVSVYGKFNNEINLAYRKENRSAEMALNGEAGLSVKALFFKWSKALVKGRYVYLKETSKRKNSDESKLAGGSEPEAFYYHEPAPEAYIPEGVYDIENYYIDRQDVADSEFNGNVKDVKAVSDTAVINEILKEGVYFGATPVLTITDNGSKVLVWTEDIKERTTGNHTAIVYSIYDEKGGIWTDPKILDDNQTFDANPEVLAHNNKIYVAWMDSSKNDFNESSLLDEVAASTDIEVVVIDTNNYLNTVSSPIHYGTCNTLDMMPRLFEHDEHIYLSYVTNSNNNPLLISGTNNVHCINLSGTDHSDNIVLTETKPVLDINLGNIGDELYLACILDEDGNVETPKDQDLYVEKISNNAIKKISGNEITIDSPVFTNINGKNILTWNSNGNICYTEDGDTVSTMTGNAVVADDYAFVKHGDKTVMLDIEATDYGSALSYHEMNGFEIGKPVIITGTDSYLNEFSVASDAGAFYVAYLEAKPNITSKGVGEISSLCIEEISKKRYSSLSITEMYHDESLVKSNGTVPVEFTVKNTGLTPITSFDYYIYKTDDDYEAEQEYLVGSNYAKINQPVDLPIGESASFTVDVPVGELTGKALLGLNVVPGNGHYAEYGSSIAENYIGYPDLTVDTDITTSVYSNSALVTIGNIGAIDTKVYLNIREGSIEGPIIKTFYVGEIGAGEQKVFSVPSEVIKELNSDRETVVFEAVSAIAQNYNNNSYDLAHMETYGYLINFDANGGITYTPYKKRIKESEEKVTYGVLPVPEREGYVFAGWFNDEGIQITSETEYTKNADETLTAKWEQANLTVSFDTGCGVYVDPIEVSYNGTYGSLPVPTLPGRTFKGWYLEENQGTGYIGIDGLDTLAEESGIGTEIKPDTVVSIASDHTLYAKYDYKYTVETPKFYIDGESVPVNGNSVEVEAGARLTIKTNTKNAKIYYTTDRTEPDTEIVSYGIETGTKLYDDAIILDKNTTIKAIAVKPGYNNSDIASSKYTIRDDSNNWGDIVPEDRVDYENAYYVPSSLWIGKLSNKPYTGKKITQDVRVYYGKTRLLEGTDYKVSYKNNVNAGTAEIKITGKGNYKGVITGKYKILPRNLELNLCEAEDIYLSYTGRVLKGKTTITYTIDDVVVKLKEGKDYTLIYPRSQTTDPDYDKKAFREEGDYIIIVDGKGNYTGSTIFNQTITKKPLLNKAQVKKIASKPYTGKAVVANEDEFVIKLKGKTLTYGKDFTVEYKNNVDSGKATVYIKGTGEYSGVKKVNFTINGTKIGQLAIEVNNDLTYTGSEIEPSVRIYKRNASEPDLILGKDYTIKYENNVNAGRKAKVIITGKGAYSGTVKKSFKINPYIIKTVSGNQISYNGIGTLCYEKGGNKPELVITDNFGKVLKAGKDYSLVYKNNKKTAASTDEKAPTVTIKGKGNYKGTIDEKFTIVKRILSISDNAIEASAKDIIYKNGYKFKKTSIKIPDVNGKNLTAGVDYKKAVVYKYAEDTVVMQKDKDGSFKQIIRLKDEETNKNDILSAGTELYAEIEGINNYDGKLRANFRIILADISKANVKISSKVYTGKKIYITKNDITSIKIGKENLKRDDYEIVAIRNNVKKGKGQVLIRGVGEYGGEKIVTFSIIPKTMNE